MSGGATAAPESDTSNQVASNQVVTNVTNTAKPDTSNQVVTKTEPDTSNPVVNKTDAAPGTGTTVTGTAPGTGTSPGTGTGTTVIAAAPGTGTTVTDAAPGTAGTAITEPVTEPATTDEPVTANGPAVGPATKLSSDNCLKNPSIFSTVPSSCINRNAVPQLRKLVEAAIYQPVAAAGGELVSNALELTGNAALVEAALATALTPEQAAMLKTMSKNPKVAQTLAEIRGKLSRAVTQSIETAKQTVAPQVEEAAGQVVNGAIVSIMNAISDIPGVGIFLSGLGFVDTGVKAIEKAGGIKEAVETAAKPITDAIENVSELANTLNEAASAATASVNAGEANASENAGENASENAGENESENERAPGAPGQEFEMQPMGASEANASKATASKANASEAIKQTDEEEKQGGGGSRKRRRIHKLSRRIARTLRRVQKKYGLGLKDKEDFLRRTLNAKKLK
jgi:hypothetical protein